jgi:hypothetical protein
MHKRIFSSVTVNNKKFFLVITGTLCVCAIVIAGGFFFKKDTKKTHYIARDAIEYTELLVREKKPEPTISSLAYAYSATAYYQVLKETASTTLALEASRYFSARLLATTTKELDKSSSVLVRELLARSDSDGRNSVSFQKPYGEYVWVDRDVNASTPFTPNAGKWKRWNVEGVSFFVPAPPQYLGKEYNNALEEVKTSAENRIGEQVAAVNFWGGIPGTNQPAGIWLDFFYETTRNEKMTEEEFAYRQMILAQTLSDAFMECWKVKYIYWTKRPDMVNTTIHTAMPNPPFPSYVSGHSTISFAAATVLGYFFPNKKEMYLQNAEEAKNSRLWAGIHFSYDNEEGKKLGRQVGEEVIKTLYK